MTAKTRIAFYARVSSDEQRERQTIRTQLEELERLIERSPELQLVDVYKDDGVSGMVDFARRPEGRRLLEDARRGRFEVVYVYRFDRLGRDTVGPHLVRRDLEDAGVRLHSLSEGEPSDLMYGVVVAVAAAERKAFLERSLAGTNRAARAGRYTGGIVSFGYRVEGEKETAILVPDDTRVCGDLTAREVIERIFYWAGVLGWSSVDIATELNALGVPPSYEKDSRTKKKARGVRRERTRGTWQQSGVVRLIHNTIYKGLKVYGKHSANRAPEDLITAPVEPIVSEELWEAAQQTLLRNRIFSGGRPRRVYLLRGVIFCGHCGRAYCGSWNKKAGRGYYRDGGRVSHRYLQGDRCFGKDVSLPNIEPLVEEPILRFLRNPGDLLAELESECREASVDSEAERDRRLLAEAIADCDQQRTRLVEGYRVGALTLEEFRSHTDEVDERRRACEARMEALTLRNTVAPIDLDLLARLRERLDEGLTMEERQALVQLLVRRVTVFTDIGEDGKARERFVVEYRLPEFGVVASHTGMDWRRLSMRSWQGRSPPASPG